MNGRAGSSDDRGGGIDVEEAEEYGKGTMDVEEGAEEEDAGCVGLPLSS